MGPKKNAQKDTLEPGDLEDVNDELNTLRDRLVAANMENDQLGSTLRDKLTEAQLERDNLFQDFQEIQRTNREKDRCIAELREEMIEIRNNMQQEQRANENDFVSARADLVENQHHPRQQQNRTQPQVRDDNLRRNPRQFPPQRHHGVRYDVPLPGQMLYDGKSPYECFIRPFKTLAETCGWDDREKAFRLINALRSDAADFVFNQLSPDVQNSFYALERVLESRFKERRSTSSYLAELDNRRLGTREKVVEYVTDIKKLVRKAYPTADELTFNTINVRHFLKGVGDQQIALAIGMKEPRSIDEAGEMLEMYNSLKEESGKVQGNRMRTIKPDKKDQKFVTEARFSEFKKEIQDTLTSKFDEIALLIRGDKNNDWKRQSGADRKYRKRDATHIECFKCHEMGHYANGCPNTGTGTKGDEVIQPMGN